MRVSSSTGFGVPVVLRDEADERVARLVQSRAGWSQVVACAIDTSDGMRALVKGVVTPWGSTIVARRWWLWARVWRVVRTYLDSGNGVGKIPSRRCRRHVLGGRCVIPNACVLLCESRSKTTCRRGALCGLGVGLRARIYRVLNGLGRIVPSGSGVVGVHRWSHRWVSGIMGVDRAGVGLSECT